MQRSTLTDPHQANSPPKQQLRLHPSVHLCRGDTVGAFVDPMFRLDDGPKFGPARAQTPTSNLEGRLINQLEQLASHCEVMSVAARPLVLPVPICVLETPALIDACLITIQHTRLCPQEIAFEFSDADLVRHSGFEFNLFRSLRMRGIRVAIDARKSFQSRLQPMSWLMVDSLRISGDHIELDQALDDMVANAAEAGVSIVVDKPKWRDGDYLAKMGIEYGVQPRLDA